ncbi:hypothetical protein GW17_00033802 [Ensete ventricosum]|nr:hypothetical protein GW17_00033802 [Ensete ventricosum]
MEESKETAIGEVEGGGEVEFDHHIIGKICGSVGEDKMVSSRDEDTQGEERGSGDHCVSSVRLVDANPLEVGSKALELVVNAGESVYVRCPTMQ